MAVDKAEQIGKLLNLAENTDNPQEAATFLEQAQRLAFHHSIDIARAREAVRDKTVIERRVVEVGAPRQMGLLEKLQLYVIVGTLFDLRVDVRRDKTAAILFGYVEDIDQTVQMYNHLYAQMLTEQKKVLNEAEATAEREEFGTSIKTQKLSFQTGFNSAMQKRLEDRKKEAVALAKAEDEERKAQEGYDESSGTDLVLVRKKENVQNYYTSNSTARGTVRTSARTSYSGQSAVKGAVAGRNASLKSAGQLPGARKQVTS